MIERSDSKSDLVVLVHGFGAKRAVMWPLASRLRANGFRVLNWNYLSLFASIETHASRLSEFFAAQLSREPRFHIVAHSMGSIVTRAALNRSSLPNLGRLVLLAPPNAGSPAARFASFFIGRVITPARELSDQDWSYVNQLRQQTELDVGILAARYDILVPEKNTHLCGERMHETLCATHNSLLFSRAVSTKIVRFLRTGDFILPDNKAPHRSHGSAVS
jgi:predicted alpha/beta hydrolase family esterase